MKRKRVIFSLLIALLVVLPLTSACAAPAPAGPITLTMVGAWAPEISVSALQAMYFMDEVNKRAEGRLIIEYKGAKEIMPAYDQPEGLLRGVFDVWYGAPNYWAGVVPAGYASETSPYDPPDGGPGSELFDYFVTMFEEKGARYLGHFSGSPTKGNHYLHTVKKIEKVTDFAGMKIRVPPLTRFVVEALGAEPVTLPPGDAYIALERGVIDGLSWPFYDSFTAIGYAEVAKYTIDHPLYRSGIGIAMNLNSWNRLPEDLQDVVTEVVFETQTWSKGWVDAMHEAEKANMIRSGMEFIKLPPAEAARFEQIANDSIWAYFKTVVSPERYTKLRQLLGHE